MSHLSTKLFICFYAITVSLCVTAVWMSDRSAKAALEMSEDINEPAAIDASEAETEQKPVKEASAPVDLIVIDPTVSDAAMPDDQEKTDAEESSSPQNSIVSSEAANPIDLSTADPDPYSVKQMSVDTTEAQPSESVTDARSDLSVSDQGLQFLLSDNSFSEYRSARIQVTGATETILWSTDSEYLVLTETVDGCEVTSEVAGDYMIYAVTQGQTYTFPMSVYPHSEEDMPWVVIEKPTCEESGVMSQICTDCGRTLYTMEIPPYGHNEGDWTTVIPVSCTQDGQYDLYCTECGVLLDSITQPAKGHIAGDWETVSYATPYSDGLEQRCCIYCGMVMEEKVTTYVDIVMEDINERGAVGRLSIPAAGIDVALFDSNSQAVCDASDSANYFYYYSGSYMICDHNYQGFSPIEWLGDGTPIYITTASGTYTYTISGRDYAINVGGVLYDLSGTNNFAYWKPACSIVLKTCTSDNRDILVYCY